MTEINWWTVRSGNKIHLPHFGGPKQSILADTGPFLKAHIRVESHWVISPSGFVIGFPWIKLVSQKKSHQNRRNFGDNFTGFRHIQIRPSPVNCWLYIYRMEISPCWLVKSAWRMMKQPWNYTTMPWFVVYHPIISNYIPIECLVDMYKMII